MNESAEVDMDSRERERREFRSHAWGAGLALLLTLIPFTAVYRNVFPRSALLIGLAVFALAQMLVHFRFFLHIGFHRKREDLLLILFSALLLSIMVAGTVWIMTNLASRMSPLG